MVQYLSMRLWGIMTQFVGFIPQSLCAQVSCVRFNFNIWKLANFNTLTWFQDLGKKKR